jgi:hypothetical protein
MFIPRSQSFLKKIVYIQQTFILYSTVMAKPEGAIPLKAIGHNPEPVPHILTTYFTEIDFLQMPPGTFETIYPMLSNFSAFSQNTQSEGSLLVGCWGSFLGGKAAKAWS